MPNIPKFRVSLVISATPPLKGHLHHARFIQAHSLDDAGHRTIAALNLIDEPKEKANEPAGDPNDNH